ncbi:MAG: NYN domain-containing protein [Nocardioidaceae bacterium]|nr:MAG: NYN domain-containing protein [Nocardioidaceae bacterium]
MPRVPDDQTGFESSARDSARHLAGHSVEDLPAAVRARAGVLASAALGKVPSHDVPPSLRRAATFTPSRRMKIAATQTVEAWAGDERFREALITQLRGSHSDLAAALDAGDAPPSVDAAALAFLLGSDGSQELADAAAEAESAGRAAAEEERARRRVEKLTARIEELTHRHRADVAALQEQLTTVKAHNADLRRKLGQARAGAREAADRLVAAADVADRQADEQLAAEKSRIAELEADNDRLLVRTEQVERDLALARRAAKAGRDAGTLRARLLLDTIVDAASGLRRELALPTAVGRPADLVEADLAVSGDRASSGHGSLAVDDPGLLDQLIRLPRTHLIVDGYNVTKSTWIQAPLDKQRDLLLAGLGPLAARSGAEITVVFDAAEVSERPFVRVPRGVRVLFSPLGTIADDVIRELVGAEPTGRPLLVVTSDRAVVRDVVASGARVVGSAGLARLMARS